MTDTREHALRVWVTPEEKAVIDQHAESTCMSCSAYLRQLGLGYIPASKLDTKAVLHLAKVNGDMGRLGGLLKMMLTNQERRTPETERALERLLGEIEVTQQELFAIVKKIT